MSRQIDSSMCEMIFKSVYFSTEREKENFTSWNSEINVNTYAISYGAYCKRNKALCFFVWFLGFMYLYTPIIILYINY